MEDCFSPYCNCNGNPEELVCDGFKSFTQLDFKITSKIWRSVTFKPSEQLQLTDALKLNKLKLRNNANLIFLNLYSIYAYSNVFRNLMIYDSNNNLLPYGRLVNIEFKESIIRFFPYDESDFSTTKNMKNYLKCDLDDVKTDEFIFSGLSIDNLKFTRVGFESSLTVCPLIFHKVLILKLTVTNSIGSLSYSNVTGHIDKTINCIVRNVNINSNYDRFIFDISSETFFNEFIFETVSSISIFSTYLNYIDYSTLNKFKMLKWLTLELIQNPNKPDITIFSDTKWLENLNSKVNFDLEIEEFDMQRFYANVLILDIKEFPLLLTDENICLIDKFPQKSCVIPVLKYTNCSCSFYWLYRYYPLYKFIDFDPYDLDKCFKDLSNDKLDDILKKCDVKNKCGSKTTAKIDTDESTKSNKLTTDSTNFDSSKVSSVDGDSTDDFTSVTDTTHPTYDAFTSNSIDHSTSGSISTLPISSSVSVTEISYGSTYSSTKTSREQTTSTGSNLNTYFLSFIFLFFIFVQLDY